MPSNGPAEYYNQAPPGLIREKPRPVVVPRGQPFTEQNYLNRLNDSSDDRSTSSSQQDRMNQRL